MKDVFSLEASAKIGTASDRSLALKRAHDCEMPTSELEDWRYSPVADISLSDYAPQTESPQFSSSAVVGSSVIEKAAEITIINGWIIEVAITPEWADQGLEIVANDSPLQTELSGRSLFDHLHEAFSPGCLVISVPEGVEITVPVVVNNWHDGSTVVSFPHISVHLNARSSLQVLEFQHSADGKGVSVPRSEMHVSPSANLAYTTVQNHAEEHRQIARQVSFLQESANLSCGLAYFGGKYARVRVDSHLQGRAGSSQLSAAYYGDQEQIHDFRIFQHHEASDTKSDLLFKGVMDDSSGSIYTGMVHIYPDGAGSHATQENRNIKRSDDAWAWSVPNLEIENNDVHCSHASTVSPVDLDQHFYLESRGVMPEEADRLIISGFYNEVLQKMPTVGSDGGIMELIVEKLNRQRKEG